MRALTDVIPASAALPWRLDPDFPGAESALPGLMEMNFAVYKIVSKDH